MGTVVLRKRWSLALERDVFEMTVDGKLMMSNAVDDSPDLLWHSSHAAFYEPTGLETLRKHLRPGGVFALWCATHPGEAFLALAESGFARTELAAIDFENPCLRQPETNYILWAQANRAS